MIIDITSHLMIMAVAGNAALMTCYLLKSNYYDYITITCTNAGKEIYEQNMDIPTRKTFIPNLMVIRLKEEGGRRRPDAEDKARTENET